MEPFSNEVVGCSFRVDLLSARNKIDYLSMSIDDKLKHIVAIHVRPSSDEVTCYGLTRAIRDLIGLKRTMWFGMRCLTTVTSVAGLDIVLNEACHPRPPVVSHDQLHCLCLPRVSSRWKVVVDVDNLSMQYVVLGDINSAAT